MGNQVGSDRFVTGNTKRMVKTWVGMEKPREIPWRGDPSCRVIPGEPIFWDDPTLSMQMLAAHLNPANDLASRRPETIDRSVDWN